MTDASSNRVPDCERFDREHGYCIEGPDCMCEPDIGPEDVAGHATRKRVTGFDIARDGCNAHGGCLDAKVCLSQGGCTRVREADRA